MKFRKTSHRLPLAVTLSPKLCEFAFDIADPRYNNLFDWIVSRVNISMKPKSATDFVIGVLDI